MDAYQVIFEPLVTEKALSGRGERKYAFFVHPDATKVDIKNAISKLFKVKAVAVNTVKNKGKTRAIGNRTGRTPSYKKAYVTIAENQKIEELEI